MSKKSKIVLLSIYVIAFIMTFVATTMAFFVIIKVATVTPEADITSATMSSLYFGTGSGLVISADLNNFSEGMGSPSDETNATATLKAGSDGKEVSFNYNVDLVIDENELIYTTLDRKPELLLMVTDPFGNEVTSINGINYVSASDYEGFDITTKSGAINIAKDYEIKTSTEITQEWDIKVVLVNYGFSQNDNIGKKLKGKLIIYKSEE